MNNAIKAREYHIQKKQSLPYYIWYDNGWKFVGGSFFPIIGIYEMTKIGYKGRKE